jgi:catechol 2,3-dioxygenase-like lactoylglutathione lyase family enzyme
MFRDVQPFPSFSVDDVQKAKRFYGDTLGLKVSDEPMGGLSLQLDGGGSVFVYPKDDHVPATFTVLNFPTDDVPGAVQDLKQKGVRFEHYDRPDLHTDADDVMRGNGPEIAWFRDPAGNVLSVIGR